MGTSKNGAELVGKLRNTEKALTSRAPLMAAADAVKRTMEGTASRAGIRKGSRIANRSWRGVYVRRQGDGLAVGYANPAQLVNNRTKAHVIGAKGLGTRKTIAKKVTAASVVSALGAQVSPSFKGRKGAKALKINGDFAAYAKHPGTRGKKFFEAAKAPAANDGAKAAHTSMVTGLAGVFK